MTSRTCSASIANGWNQPIAYRYSRAMRYLKVQTLSQPFMQLTSLATGTRNLAMGARCCWARLLARTASDTICNSRALVQRPILVAATAAPHWVLSCENTLSAKLCSHLACRRPAAWRQWQLESKYSETKRNLGRC